MNTFKVYEKAFDSNFYFIELYCDMSFRTQDHE